MLAVIENSTGSGSVCIFSFSCSIQIGNYGSSSTIISILFGGNKSKSKKHPFDPTAECVAASQHKKKKAANTRMKARTIHVVVMKEVPSCVPKEHARRSW